ncbi:hypothetical protein KKH39_01410 [Patescibacteria group bacterium]|nr:hypothetical protein [Patescibacteria group bacterium]
MGKIQDLPTGQGFSSKRWDKGFKSSTRFGDLSSLRDNQEALSEVAKKRQSAIRRGSYDSSSRRSDYQEILKMDQSLTSRDKKYVRDILDHWSNPPKPENKTPEVKKTISKKISPRRKYERELPSFLQTGNKPGSFGKNDTKNSSPYGSPSFNTLSPGQGKNANVSSSPYKGGSSSLPSSSGSLGGSSGAFRRPKLF